MKLIPYIFLLFALTGCDFGEDKILEKITGGEPKRFFSVSSIAVAEGDTATFTVTFNRAHSETMTVPYSTTGVTATSGTDFTAAAGTLSFAPGETSKTITVSTTDDALVESSEYFLITFSAGTNYDTGYAPTQVSGVINDADTPKTIHIFSATAVEGNSVQFDVTLPEASSLTVTIDYATSDDTATLADSDYTNTSGTLTFIPGETAKTIIVNTTTDAYFEIDETFTVTLSGGSNYTVAGSTLSATGTITNNDSEPTIFFAPASANEGTNIDFTVNLSNRSYETVTVSYATSDGTATLANSDYTNTNGLLTFAPGETSKTISVPTTTDVDLEADETFTLTLSGGTNYTAAGSTLTGVGTITNNDSAPTIAIDNTSVAEGGALGFTVTLSHASSQTITVDYATANGTATLADTDYTNTSGTLTFNPGELTKPVSVNTTADTNHETNETLTVTLSGGANYTVAGSTLVGTGTINNDDSAPTISIANASANEGTAIDFTVTLSNRSYQTVTVNYALSDGTATQGDSDYPAATGTVTFVPDDTSETLSITTTGDTKYENDETFTTTLSGGSNYTVAGSTLTATGTITNNDAVPNISIASASATEGGNVVFTVTQDRTSAFTTTFDYASTPGTATGGGTDYTNAAGSTSISSGATTVTISVPVAEDSLDEIDETFTLTISNPANSAITSTVGTGTIVDTILYYDFTTGSLPAQTTFARASTATYVNSSGNIVSAASGTARFDYNPVTLSLRGLLIEPASTNLVLRSDAFDNAAWTKSSLSVVGTNAADSSSPDGVNTNAEFIRENPVPSTHVISQSIGTAITAGALVHFSVYAKDDATNPRNFLRLKISNGANEIYANFDLTGGNAPTTGFAGDGGGQLSAGVQDVGNGWKRLRLTGIASTTATTLTVAIYLQNAFAGAESYNGDNASGVNLWGAQFETGNTSITSYIPTAGATVTRVAETLTSTTFTGFSGNFGDGTNWTMITDFSRPLYEASSTTTTPTAASLCALATCANNHISQVYSSSVTKIGTQSYVGGTKQGESLSGAFTPTANSVYQLGTVKTGSSIQSFLNGTAHTASGTISFPTADTLYVGGASSQLIGHIRKFTLRARAVPSANMLVLTND